VFVFRRRTVSVSIRAPVRTRRAALSDRSAGDGVSIRAPVRTRPASVVHGQPDRHGFNPRAREDATAEIGYQWRNHQSFNPRAREDATPSGPDDGSRSNCFNPRAREDATLRGMAYAVIDQVVSIRAPVRTRRHISTMFIQLALGFNPRAREDATAGGEHVPVGGRVSIRAPVRTRQSSKLDLHTLEWVSIRAPVRTRLDALSRAFAELIGFNPRAREDATQAIA